jgi:nicotinamidase-related amidase
MASRIPAIFDAEDPCSPLCIPNSKTALLLMDYQNIITAAMGEEATKAISVARTLQKWAAENQILAVHCLVQAEGQTPKQSMKMAGRFKVMQEKLQERPALGHEDERLAKISPDEKTDARRPGFVSVLQGPRLREILNAAGMKSLILCGLSTSGCVLSTCRAATDAEYIVTVADDACADPVPGLHDMLMKYVISSTAHVAKGADLMEAWQRKT